MAKELLTTIARAEPIRHQCRLDGNKTAPSMSSYGNAYTMAFTSEDTCDASLPNTCKSSIPSHGIAALYGFARWLVEAHPHRGSYCTPHWNVVTQTSQYGSINHINTSTLHSCSSKPIPHLKMPTPHLKRPTPHLKRLFVRPQVATRKPRGVKALFPYVVRKGI